MMRNKFVIFSAIYLVAFLSAFSIRTFYTHKTIKPIIYKKGNEFIKEWKRVDSLETIGLPQSALEDIDKIYKKAVLQENIPQVVKALLYQVKIVNDLAEDGFEKSIIRIDNHIKTAKTPIRQVLHSIKAELYLSYYLKNKWRILQISNLEDQPSTDIKTWGSKKFAKEIASEYQSSLNAVDSLQRISIKTIEPIILSENKSYLKTWPTLYDFVVYRAIEAMQNDFINLIQINDAFNIDDFDCFSETSEFINIDFEKEDIASFKYFVIRNLQNLVSFHTELENPDALIDAELFRLQLVYNLSEKPEKDDLYLKALERLLEPFSNVSYSNYIRFKIAEFAQTKSSVLVSDIDKKEAFRGYNNLALNQIKTIKSAEKDSVLIQKCDYILNLIQKPFLNLTHEEVTLPNENFPVKISSLNIDHLSLNISKIDPKKYQIIFEKGLYGKDLYQEILNQSTPINVQNIDLQSIQDYQQHQSEMIVNALDKGFYILSLVGYSKENDTLSVSYSNIKVSNIAVLQRPVNDKVEIVILNRKDGTPISNAEVKIWYDQYSYQERKRLKVFAGKYVSDSNGFVSSQLNSSSQIIVEVKSENDFYSSENAMYLNKQVPKLEKNKTFIFLDRAIYRPGQTVYFKAITLKDAVHSKQLLKGQKINIALKGPNYQKISDLDLVSNEFGSVNGQFVLPQNGLTGRFQLQTSDGNISFSVEEYKRPSFEALFDDNSNHYKLNDNVEISGKAVGYAGQNIVLSPFKYRVVREAQTSYFWRPINNNLTEISSGEGITDENGKFQFNFLAQSQTEKIENEEKYFFKIFVDITDISGETQSIQKTILIGTSDLVLSSNLPNFISVHQLDSIKVITQNINGESINAIVDLKLIQVNSKNSILKDRYWQEPDAQFILKTDWEKQLPNYRYTNKSANNKDIRLVGRTQIDTKSNTFWKLAPSQKLKEGFYKLVLESQDYFGKKIKTEQFFTVFDEDSKQMPHIEQCFFQLLTPIVEPGNEAELVIGSSFRNIQVLLEIDRKNKPVEKKWISINNEKQKLKMPVNEEDRGNFNIRMSFVKENRVFQKNTLVSVPHSDKKLDITFETFRNKLSPGQKEFWKIKIKGPKGEKVAAEMLASMYDVSLDQFASNHWNFNVLDYYYGNSTFQAQGFSSNTDRTIFNSFKYLSNPQFSTPELNWFGYNIYSRYKGGPIYRSSRIVNQADDLAFAEEEQTIVTEQSTDDREEAVNKDKDTPIISGDINNEPKRMVLQMRKNFNETAFFYPNLTTNSEGEIEFNFTMPESVTSWKFNAFALTQDLKYGFVQREIITQKDLMVVPNPPRFFRENDRIEFPIKVINISDKTLSPKLSIRFYDAFTMQEMTKEICPNLEHKKFEIKAGQSEVYTINLNIPIGYSAISYKVIASCEQFSDGEEKAIPVLTNRMLVTESLPLPINGKETKTFRFEKLIKDSSSTLSHFNYTIEMTSNPIWYAVQALPSILENTNESVDQIFNRFYVNAIALQIANSNPKIKQIFDEWKNSDSESLSSSLEQNEALKSILIKETPWIIDAQSESEQKKRIAMLFDSQKLSISQESALQKLQELQTVNGGWAWFKGMKENRYMTQLIVSGLGRLRKLGAIDLQKDFSTHLMLKKAILFLDQEIVNDFETLKRYYDEKQLFTEPFITNDQIQYLYARSYFEDLFPIPKESLKTVNYFKLNAQKFWKKQSPYMQAMIALTSMRDKSPQTEFKVEDQIIASLKEFALHSEEMGMYWKEEAGYYWYNAPIEKQALMIELFSEKGNEEKSIEELKIWLLKQKQTQSWGTTRATTDAVYALLMNGINHLNSDKLVEVSVNGVSITPLNTKDNQADSGTGYYKKSWKADRINSKLAEINVSNKNEGIAWGAAYWQYFEDLDKITSSDSPLGIKKELFIEKNTKNGPVLSSIKSNQIKIGDKIVVRIIITTDRNLEFVHLKDMRASGFEPINVKSSYKWKNGLGYYESTKDASTDFFFDYILKGTYVFEYPLRVLYSGDFSNGISTIQCLYAPEFSSHSEGLKLKIEK